MLCKKCGQPLNYGAAFCGNCGEAVPVATPSNPPSRVATVTEINKLAMADLRPPRQTISQEAVSFQSSAVDAQPIGAENALNGPFPLELKRWNWGAFLFNWVWALAHNSWFGLLALFFPVVSFLALFASGWVLAIVFFAGLIGTVAVAILLGIKGNKLAWQNRKFANREEFESVQRIWARVALITYAFILALALLAIAAGVFIAFLSSFAPNR